MGNLVVTLEAASAEEMSTRVVQIQRMDDVFSAALVYQCADRLDAMNEELPHAQAGFHQELGGCGRRGDGRRDRAPVRAAGGRRFRVKWSKAPCRFCGTGCGVTVAVKDNRVIATQGDPKAEVNRGLNCTKGYYLSKIMYGEDRLTTPLLRMKNGVYAKDGEFERVSWDKAFDVHATYLESKEKTCIDCHKGIAHHLPHIPPGDAPTDSRGQAVLTPRDAASAASPASPPVKASP